jgi:hypothetical protein
MKNVLANPDERRCSMLIVDDTERSHRPRRT